MITDIKKLHECFLTCTSVSIDSRKIIPGAMFFAIQGKNNNGNEFAKQALDSGAAFAVIDDRRFKINDKCILVNNSLSYLQSLANFHRGLFEIPVIAITGSSGKTTTKELTAKTLSCKYNICATEGNLNTLAAGVPLTLLKINKGTQITVIEMGINSPGELTAICNIAMPTHGIITHVKPVHIEGFKNFEGVIQGKTELYKYLAQRPDGKIYVNYTENILVKIAKNLFKKENIKYYQSPEEDDFCEVIAEDPFLTYKTKSGAIVKTNFLGKFHLNNICASICIAKSFGINEIDINNAIKSYIPKNNRSEVIEKLTNRFFLDAYNANLESMQGAIEAFANVKNKKKIIILGAMREMGDQTENMHSSLGKFLLPYTTDFTILLCGDPMQWTKNICDTAIFFKTKEELENFLKSKTFTNTAFFLKGSRFWKLETLIDLIN